jgi:GIY-YIG catalytic domain
MREHQYFVYIMSSNSGTLYIGMTDSIYRRALQHKSGEIDGFSTRPIMLFTGNDLIDTSAKGRTCLSFSTTRAGIV